MSTYPVTFEAEYVERRSRLSTAFRLILAIPHLIVVSLYALAAYVVAFVAWFALVFAARYPRDMYAFVASFLRYQTRVYAYLHLLTDAYPSFSGSPDIAYPVGLSIGPPKERYSRWKALFRIILAIPIYVIAYAMSIVAQIGALLAWFAIVVLGRQPKGLHDMIVLGLSYQLRATAYLLLLTEDWPPFVEESTSAVGTAPAFGALPPVAAATRGREPAPAGTFAPPVSAQEPSTPEPPPPPGGPGGSPYPPPGQTDEDEDVPPRPFSA